MTAFATTYEQPVRFSPLPFEAYLYIDPGYTGNLFFEQRYLDQSKQELEVVVTAVPSDSRGLVGLLASDAHLKAAAFMELAISDTDTTLVGTGPRITLPASDAIDSTPAFATHYKQAVAFTGLPFEVSVLVDATMADREMYFERRYLNALGEEVEIKSSAIPATALGNRVRLKLDPNPLECAARVELSITDTYRAYNGSCDGSPPVRVKIFDFTFDFTFE